MIQIYSTLKLKHKVTGTAKLLSTLLSFVSLTFSAQTYCPASAVYTADDEIFNVTLGTLNNTTNCSSVGGPGSSVSQYNDYTALTPPVLYQGATYPLSVTVGMCDNSSYSGIVGVWIDFNQNGSFYDPNENVFMSPYTSFAISGTAVSPPGGITIPINALPGTTRMRVIETESSTSPDPCIDPDWGEVEDYNVTIVVPPPIDLGVSAILKPLGSKICFGVDTIVTSIYNYGSGAIDFSTNPGTITVVNSGPNASTFTLSLTSGTITPNSTQTYTVTTAFNMSNIGTYNLKAYTSVSGDGGAINDTTSVSITKNPFFSTSALPDDSVCLGVPVQLNANYDPLKQVGSGTIENTSTSYPAPYGNFYEGAKHQFLFLASELSAAGVTAGNINSIAFNATNLNNTDPLMNFNIAIATTALTSLSSFQTSGFTTYYSSSTYSPVLGLNTHVFSTPFVWDGVSNIIIETCFNNAGNGYTNNVSITQSTTSFNSSIWDNADSDPTLCSSTSVNNSLNQRPNVYFEQPITISYSWTPSTGLSGSNIANPIANVSTTTTYTITGTTPGCMSYDTVRIFVKPTPVPMLGNDTLVCSLPVTLYANTTANSYQWNNNSIGSSLNITSSGQYWVKATNANGCFNSDTINITLGTSPIVTLGQDTAFCQGSFINLYAGNSTNTYLWNTGATSPSITVSSAGTYSVLATNSSGCKTSDIINISTKAKPTVSLVFSGQTKFCPTESGRTLTEGTPSGGTYIGAGVSGNTFNANQAGQGVYIIAYNYTDPSTGCNNISKDTLVVNPCVGVEELNETISLNVYPNPSNGIYTVELNTLTEMSGQITVSSIDGKLVYRSDVSGNGLIYHSVNVSEIATGIYYLRIETKNGSKTYKLMKQ